MIVGNRKVAIHLDLKAELNGRLRCGRAHYGPLLSHTPCPVESGSIGRHGSCGDQPACGAILDVLARATLFVGKHGLTSAERLDN